jgi:hypothetical protein
MILETAISSGRHKRRSRDSKDLSGQNIVHHIEEKMKKEKFKSLIQSLILFALVILVVYGL